MSERRKYSKTEYFDFLVDYGFNNNRYRDLAKVLHNIDYVWENRMDENRMYDGVEIRKYYLCDELGYMPDDIDEYDDYIFPPTPSVLEVLVGFSNRLCRDVLNWEVPKLIKIFLGNWGIDYKSDKDEIKSAIIAWENGELGIFGENINTDLDLWTQATLWMQEFG